jgi:hypothetical protein
MSPLGPRCGRWELERGDTSPEVVAMQRQVVACAASRGCITVMDARVARDGAVSLFDLERCRKMSNKRARQERYLH